MTMPFVGEIKMMGFNFAPRGWATCDGQVLAINQNQALFSLFGTNYGGNGTTNFALPNLRGTVPVHMGNGVTQGEAGGAETVTLTANEMPAHNHVASVASSAAEVNSPTNCLPGVAPINVYKASNNLVPMAPEVQLAGGSQPHENRQPSLVINFCVALVGIFPTRQ